MSAHNYCPNCRGACACETGFTASVECQVCTAMRARGAQAVRQHQADHQHLVRIDFAAGPGGTIKRQGEREMHFTESQLLARGRAMGFTQADLADPVRYARVEASLVRERRDHAEADREGAIIAAARELGIDPAQARTFGEPRTRAILRANSRHPELFAPRPV